jgi:hypothetical protein
VPEDELDGVRVVCLERAPLDMKRIMVLIQRGGAFGSHCYFALEIGIQMETPEEVASYRGKSGAHSCRRGHRCDVSLLCNTQDRT